MDTVDIRMAIAKRHQTDLRHGIDHETPLYWMDCGNGKDFGQVFIGTLSKIRQPKDRSLNTTPTLKSVVDVYGNLNEYNNGEIQGIESCSFLDSILKQDLFINDEIALTAAKMLRKLLKSPYIESNGAIVNQSLFKVQPFSIC